LKGIVAAESFTHSRNFEKPAVSDDGGFFLLKLHCSDLEISTILKLAMAIFAKVCYPA
jgi:hypothetical protein